MNWLRWYVGTCTDAKLHKASRVAGVRRSAMIAGWAAVLEEARRNGDDGNLADLDPSWMSGQIDEPASKCRRIIDAMRDVGLVNDLNVSAFSRRQFASDNSTVRVRAHRDKLLKSLEATPEGNVSDETVETHQNRTEQNIISLTPLVPPHGGHTNGSGSSKPKAQRRKPAVSLPENWSPDVAYARAQGLNDREINLQANKLVDWAKAGDQRCVDWQARWRNWCRSYVERRNG